MNLAIEKIRSLRESKLKDSPVNYTEYCHFLLAAFMNKNKQKPKHEIKGKWVNFQVIRKKYNKNYNSCCYADNPKFFDVKESDQR